MTDLGACHIADANLAKRLDDTAAPHPTFLHGSPFVGTPRYAAPEQFAGEDATPATDIHALGVVIGELFGGRMPLSWRWLLYRMTASSGGVRLQTVRAVRRQLALVRLFPWCVRMLVIVAVLVAAHSNGDRPQAYSQMGTDPKHIRPRSSLFPNGDRPQAYSTKIILKSDSARTRFCQCSISFGRCLDTALTKILHRFVRKMASVVLFLFA